jgi:DtxR family Mn-dependent transcriptional regulator
MATGDLTRSQREALKAIHRFQSTTVGGTHTGDLAAALERSPATVSALVKQLAELGLVDHRPYHGVELTARGEAAATTALRRQQVVERFLAEVLGFDAGDVRRLAARFEHALSPEVEERLASATNHDIERRERAC